MDEHVHCPKGNQNFRDVTRNAEENEMLHEKFRVVSRAPHYISCYISENQVHLEQCTTDLTDVCSVLPLLKVKVDGGDGDVVGVVVARVDSSGHPGLSPETGHFVRHIAKT